MAVMAKIRNLITNEHRYIRPHDVIPKGWTYVDHVEVTEAECTVLSDVKVTTGIDTLLNITEGRKDDQDKARLELLHPDFLLAAAAVMTFGATKYDDWNWYKGMSWGRVYGALQRHLLAWHKRTPSDVDTGKSHLWHAACCLMFLVVYEIKGIGTDDRPKA